MSHPAESFQPMSGNAMPRFGGITTMMRLPAAESTAGLDACFVGVPFDLGTSNRNGARMGPRQIRAESVLLRPYNMATRAAPFDSLRVADIGDVATNPYNLHDSIDRIEAAYREIIAGGCRPIGLGGDHTVTLPILRAMHAKYGRIGLIHIDAHADDYSGSNNKESPNGCGIFLSYTWNDDSLKFLGDPNVPAEAATHADMCRQVLHSIYPGLKLEDYLVPAADSQVEIHWENEPYYLGAFKMNLPGDYERQRRLFSQFMSGVGTDEPDRFILAGDDVSWVAGWVEGAISTAINAVNKVAVAFGGGDVDGNPGPISSWETLKPVELPTLAPRFVPHR